MNTRSYAFRIFVVSAAFIMLAGIVPERPASAQAGKRVTDVSLAPISASPTGKCPVKVGFRGSITTDGPVTVEYRFVRSDGANGAVQSMTFKTAGTQAVETDWTIGDAQALPSYSGWIKLVIVSPKAMESSADEGAFSMTCGMSAAPDPQSDARSDGKNIKQGTPKVDLGNVRTREGGCEDLPGGCIPANASGNFRFVANGFKANRRTNDKFLDEDGAKDEIFLIMQAQEFNAAGRTVGINMTRQTLPVGDTNNQRGRVRGGSASTILGGNGGFETGDAFPGATPWNRTLPFDRSEYGSDVMFANHTIPLLAWEGMLTQGRNAVVLTPTVWELDVDATFLLVSGNDTAMGNFYGAIAGTVMSQAIRENIGKEATPEMEALARTAYERMRIPDGDNEHDRPIGMDWRAGHFGFTPQIFVFTYEAAYRMSHTDIGFGRGVFPVRYRDSGSMVGDYTIFIQVERY